MTEKCRAFLFQSVAAVLFVTAMAPLVCGAQKQTREVPVESMIHDLTNPDPVRRKEAAIVLGKNKVQRAVPDLVKAAGDSDPAVRREIVIALDKIRDVGALPAFASLSADQEKDIRDKAIVGLVNLYIPQDGGFVATISKVGNLINPWSDEWAEVVVEPGVPVDPRTVEALRARLKDSDEGIRLKAARGLGIVRGKAAVPSLVETTNMDSSNGVRFESVRAIRKIGDPSAATQLMNLLSYPDRKLRNEVVYTLGRLRAREAVPELMRLLELEASKAPKDIDKDFLSRLLGALAFIGDPQSKEVFARFRESPDPVIRMYSAEGFARTGDASMASGISREWLTEKDARVRAAQAFALYRMQRKEFLDEVVRALGTRQANEEAAACLATLRPEEIPDLFEQAKNDNVDVRESLADLLGHIGDLRAIPTLEALTRDTRGQIAPLANQAIRRVNAKSAASN